MTADPNQHDIFVLRQKIKLAINHYEFFLANAAGTPGEPIAFVEQKRFKFKEDIRFYTDESKTQELLRIKARQRFDPRATYDITDETGAKIGEIRRSSARACCARRSASTTPSGQELFISTEKSMPIALTRRAVGFIPYVENVANWLPIPYHFVFKRGEEIIGENRRQIGKFRDIYTIDMSADPARTIDRRLVLALAVGQDALQAR